MVTIACHYWSFYDLPLETALVEAAARGYDAMDLGTGDIGYGERLGFTDLTDGVRLREISAAARDAGIRFTDIFMVLPFPTNAAESRDRVANREQFLSALPGLRALGVPGVTLSPGASSSDTSVWQVTISELAQLVRLGREFGLRVTVEPHVESIAATVANVHRLLGAVPGLRLTLDYSHLIASGESQATIETLDTFADHWHARQARPGRVAVPRSDGMIDFSRVVRRLVASGYSGAIAVEYVRSSWQDQDKLDVDGENDGMRRELLQHFEMMARL